ncbi:hypothetical protein I4F81_008899 [Pyropia yezoensis]|uniref:Uncharacterized protein n=1 Tax=Pyropia yezoensis TaxID=2788 RepID=A0ACC3C8V9_PYRYE|nr:hypothetical protein I4F81_008899 [Neopyropia yezoensis]
MQEVQAAGSLAAGRASPSAHLLGRRWAPETPLSHVSSPTGLSVQGGHGVEKQLPQLTVSAYGGGRGDGGGAAYGLTPAAGVAASTPVPVGPVPSGTKQSVRLLVPAEKYPDFNFVGRILGPRGATLKALERETSCKIMIRGRGSIRRDKEAEVRGKPGWAHCFSDPLHVIIEADAADEAAATRALNRAKEAVELFMAPRGAFPSDIPQPGMLGCQTSYGGASAPSIKTLVASTGGTPVPISTGVGSGGFMSQDFYGGAFSDYGRSAEARGWSSPTEVLSAPAPQTDNQDGQPAA